MGRRSQTESVAGIYQAFLQRRTWSQASLANDLDVTVGTLRRVRVELQTEGMPLHRDEDHPRVYWSVGKDWYPGSVLFKRAEVPELLRQLRRVPRRLSVHETNPVPYPAGKRRRCTNLAQ